MKGVEARKLAVDVLVKVEMDKAYSTLALSAAFNKKTLSERDRAFATFLVQGVLRHRDELDEAISKLSTQPLDKMTPLLRNVLRMAVYQLKYADDIPESAIVNTATEIGKTGGHAGIGKFVTGVLRTYIRKNPHGARKQVTPEVGKGDDSVEGLAKRYSVPEWLIARWLEQRGLEQTRSLLEYSQQVPELTVRTCESGVTTEALLNLFTSHGIKARQGKLVPSCLIIEDRGKYKGPIEKLPGYNDGLFIVQDEAAAFASQVVDAKPGNVVVDLCAAPGGKAIHIAEMMENKGRVIAVDTHANRLELLKKTRNRVGLTNIEVFPADGTVFKADIAADKVLLDAPCTGTGVINRRTDLRFKRESPDLNSLVDLQRRLLDNAAQLLKPGGILVYSTCSIEPEENEQNMQWFLDTHRDFHPTSLVPFVPEGFPISGDSWENGWVQLLPSQHEMSGFFVARMQKSL